MDIELRGGTKSVRERAVVIWLAMAALSVTGVPDATAEPPPFRFGDYVTTIAPLEDPSAVVIADDGEIYIAETGADRISVYSTTGARRRTIGEPGSGPGQLLAPRGVAVTGGPNGAVYVSDTGNHRIQIFDLNGNFIRGFGSRGARPGLLNEPHGITVDDEFIYVADLGNRRVQTFDLEGRPQLTMGGGGERGMRRPVDVAIGGGGEIFVTDADRNGVVRFGPSGQPIDNWGDWGPFLGLMDNPSGIVCLDDHVYLADTRNHRVQVYDIKGEHVTQWGVHAVTAHEGEGKLHYPNDLAIAPGGALAVVCEGFENRCQIFLRAETPAEDDGIPPMSVQKMKAHFGERIDIDGKLLTVAEPENHRIYVFELSRDIPIIIGDFGDRGPRPGQMIRLAGLALDADDGWLYATDLATQRIQGFRLEYDPEGPRGYDPRRARFARAWDLEWMRREIGVHLPWPIEPTVVRCTEAGDVYMLDRRNAVVIGLDREMVPVSAFGGFGTGEGMFRDPTDIAFSVDGKTIFVVDAGNHRVQAFDTSGSFVHAFGSLGSESGQFRRPFGIAAGRDEFVYVTDESRHRVLKFKESGAFVTEWGQLGVEQGDLWKPKGVAQDERHRVYVVDYGNHRAQAYSPEGEWMVSFGTGRAYTKWDGGRGTAP